MSALNGMTGFGRGEASGEAGTASAEIRSVNGKGLDIRVRLPHGLDRLEAQIKARIKQRFARGSVSATVSFAEPEGAAGLDIDTVRLEALARAAGELVEKGLAEPARADGLLALKGVLTSEAVPQSDPDAIDALVLGAVDEGLGALQAARSGEGEQLEAMLAAHLEEIERLREHAEGHEAASPAAIKARLQAKFDDLLPEGLDPDRLAQEAALLAVKADVREELDRLKAHIETARTLIGSGSPAGRKLDFLAQEFNREANTLCSKAGDRELTDLGLQMKAAIDQMREQVQNVE